MKMMTPTTLILVTLLVIIAVLASTSSAYPRYLRRNEKHADSAVAEERAMGLFVKRGFKNGAGDRFSHGFGKRSDIDDGLSSFEDYVSERTAADDAEEKMEREEDIRRKIVVKLLRDIVQESSSDH